MSAWNEPRNLLQKEHDELNVNARHNIQIYFAWFTFFITTNFVAMGLVVSQVTKSQPKVVALVVVVGLFFCFQSALSVVGNSSVERMYVATSKRLDQLVEILAPQEPASADRSHIQAIVLQTYLRVIRLNTLTLKSMIVCWLLIMCATVFVVVI